MLVLGLMVSQTQRTQVSSCPRVFHLNGKKKQEKLLILLSYNNVPLSTPPALSEIRNSDRNVIMGHGNVLPLAFPVVIDSRMELLYFLLTTLFFDFFCTHSNNVVLSMKLAEFPSFNHVIKNKNKPPSWLYSLHIKIRQLTYFWDFLFT